MSQIDPKIKTLIEDSGIILHNKATNILRNNEWSVLVSPYYQDTITDLVRETDLIAEKQINSSSDNISRHSSFQINIQLFIECKYIKQEIIFLFDKIDKDKAVENLEKETGLSILHNKSSADIIVDKFIHLQNDDVAKLFSSNTNKEDVMYKAMNQCLHAQIYYRTKGRRSLMIPFNGRSGSSSKVIQRPVIVCDNFEKLFKVDIKDDGTYQSEVLKNHFVLETNYRDDYFLIDIVDINYLEQFLLDIQNESKRIMDAHL